MRKKGIALLALILCLGLLLSNVSAFAAVQGTQELIILHTNDIHSRANQEGLGYAAVKSVKDEYLAQGKAVLLLDAGDTFHGLPIASVSKGENIVRIMNAVGYDAMTLGNHDFNYGVPRLRALAAQLDADVLSLNVTDEFMRPCFQRGNIYNVGGIRVGVIGVSTPDTVFKASPKLTAGLRFNSEYLVDMCQREIRALQADGAEYIVLLCHLGIDASSAPFRSTDLIQQLYGVDLVIDGHSHTTLEKGLTVFDRQCHPVLIAQTGCYLNAIGKVSITAQGLSASLITSAERDPAVQALIDEMQAKTMSAMNATVADLRVALDGERQTNRRQETNLGDLSADAIRHVGGADIGLINGGGLRVSLPAGKISYYDLNCVFPFGNIVTVLRLTGAQLKEALESGCSFSPQLAGRFPQVSGVTFDLHQDAASNRVRNIRVNGQPLDLRGSYTVATNDFIATGGDGYVVMKDAEQIGFYGTVAEALVLYVREVLGGIIGQDYAVPQGRVNVVLGVSEEAA